MAPYISDLTRVEGALRRAVRARDQVLGIVAHDLRNPLNEILAATQLLARRRTEATEEADAKPLEVIRRQATRMNRHIQDLLDVARIESGVLSVERSRVAVQPLLREVLDMQQAIAAAASMTLRLDIEGQPSDMWADRERIVQVFENLIGNAVKFTPAGGLVSLGATSRESDTVLWVADTGPGIPPEAVPRLFDRFWQAAAQTTRCRAGAGHREGNRGSARRAHLGGKRARSGYHHISRGSRTFSDRCATLRNTGEDAPKWASQL